MDETLDQAQPTGGLNATIDKSGKISAAGKVALDATQTAEILANMQNMINSRQGPMQSFNRGLERAAAWGSGGIQGPSAALNQLNQQQQAEDKSTFEMRQQMAAYKAAQAQQEAFNKRKSADLGGGFGATPGGVNEATMPPQIRNALNNAATQEEYNKIYNTWAQKQAEIYANPSMDEPKIPVVENVGGQWVRKTISAREYRANPGKYQDTPQTQAAVNTANAPSAAAPGAPMSVRNNNPGNLVDPATGKIRTFATPQEGDAALEGDLKLKLSGQSPVVKERFGPQVGNFMSPALLAETWAPSTAKGNTPESTQNYGKAIADSLGMSDPTAQILNTPEALGKAKAAIAKFEAGDNYKPTTTATATATAPAAGLRPTVAQLEQEEKAQEAYKTNIGKGQAENIIKDEAAFRASTEPKSVVERKTSAERVVSLVEQNPKAVGILTKPGVGTALMTIARDGLNTPSGAIGIKTIEDALVLAMPGVDQRTVNARKEIAQNLARGALEASKLSQGQGSVSDFERSMFERIAGSLADTPDLLIKRQKMLIARAELDQKLGEMYRATKVSGKPTDYEAFTANPNYTKMVDQYEERLRGILGSEATVNKQGPISGKTSGGIQYKVITPAKPQ